MSDDFDLGNILTNWLHTVGTEVNDRKGIPYVKLRPSEYQDAITSLLETLAVKGKDRDYFISNYFLSELQKILTPKWAKRKHIEVMKEDIRRALEFCVDDRHYDPKDIIIVKPPEKEEKPKLNKKTFQGLPPVKDWSDDTLLKEMAEVDDE